MTWQLNALAVWIGIVAGMLTGAATGLNFHREDWWGGYGSWRRRLVRLGHISFFGLAGVNLAFALSAVVLDSSANLAGASRLLLVGTVTMPAVCFLAAWRPAMRRLFFIPVLSLLTGSIWTAVVFTANLGQLR